MTDFIASVERDGFAIDVDAGAKADHQFIHCKQFHCDITVHTYLDPKDNRQTFAVVPYPPFSRLPWRWLREQRLFDDLTSHLDQLESHAD